ncbi:MAG TPA: hypothetical protein VMJ10_28610 [Kofleriaceae bacterium]|nr:hypothetical protein [Kofleriaceae bacterium]
MWQRSLVLALAGLESCASRYALHGSQSDPPRPLNDRGSLVDLPPAGAARSDVLRDGWPVWVVRHDDGSATVVSAVAPRVVSAATLFAGRAALVRWLPTTRRFVADDVMYDEYGRVLGYASDDACIAGCPHVIDPAFGERDLDRFAAAVAFDRAVVDDFLPSPARDDAERWVDWDREPHAAHELAVGRDDVSPPAIAVADATRIPLGDYAVVAGSIVQSTSAAPHICADSPRCAACEPESPLALGVPRVALDQPAIHATSGTILVRREPTGLAVIATSRAGECPGSADAIR